MYNRGFGKPHIFEKLCHAIICSILSVKKHLLSKRKQKLNWFKNEQREMHPDDKIEQFLSIIKREKGLTADNTEEEIKITTKEIKNNQKLDK